MLKYNFSWGVLYNAFPHVFNDAFRKINISVHDNQIDIFEKLQEELRKSLRTSQLTFAASDLHPLHVQ